MNIEKYTDRVRGFIQSAQSLAMREGHQQFSTLHILKVLLDDPEGLAAGLIDRAGGNSRATLMNDSSSRSHCFVTLTLLEATAGAAAKTVSDPLGNREYHQKEMGFAWQCDEDRSRQVKDDRQTRRQHGARKKVSERYVREEAKM